MCILILLILLYSYRHCSANGGKRCGGCLCATHGKPSFLVVAMMLVVEGFVGQVWSDDSASPTSLEQTIKLLDGEPTGLVLHLGVARPGITDAVKAVLVHGVSAKPQLRNTLKSRKPVSVGCAALCLKELEDFDNEETAMNELTYFKSTNPSDEREFVVAALKWYIRKCKIMKSQKKAGP